MRPRRRILLPTSENRGILVPTRAKLNILRSRTSLLVYVQQNAELDVVCFPPHVRLPQVSVGRTVGSSPSRVHGFPRRPHLARDDLRDDRHEWGCAGFLTYFMVVLVGVMLTAESLPSPKRFLLVVPSEDFEY